tara:strand:+ start:852 stop:1166 length:315 start_codon:yes stop_codon:yes gene_type:complete
MKNLTPHKITIRHEYGSEEIIQPSGDVARVSIESTVVSVIAGIVIRRAVPGEITGLPTQSDEPLIVSAHVRLAAPDRTDLFSPGELIRDADGNPIACDGLFGNL